MPPTPQSTPPSSGEHGTPVTSISSTEHLKMVVDNPSTKLSLVSQTTPLIGGAARETKLSPGQQTLSPNKQHKFSFTLDFSKPEALRELTYAVLKRDFDLKVHLPLNKLIPAVPQRLNYIHWIEDLLKLCEGCVGDVGVAVSSESEGCEEMKAARNGGDVIGIDIGQS